MSIYERIKSYDSMDIALWVLSLALAVFVAILLWSNSRSDPEPWAAIEYVIPAQIITNDNHIPAVEGVDSEFPTFPVDDIEIPVRSTRLVDCKEYDCPGGALPYTVTVRWQGMNEDGQVTTIQYTVLDEFEASLIEGTDYLQDESGVYTNQLNPVRANDEVLAYIKEQGGDESLWRIETEIHFDVLNAPPVSWSTEIFCVKL